MPTAVVELELNGRSGGLGVPGGHPRALILLRPATPAGRRHRG